MDLQFREDGHEYRLNGVLVPSVTQVLKPITDYSHVDPDQLERARQEGVAIHRMVELDARGRLAVSRLPEWIRPFYDGLQRCKRETGMVVFHSEHRVYHPVHRYAGTLDLHCGFPLIDVPQSVTDVKRSFAMGRAIGPQTAAYLECLKATGQAKGSYRRFGLRFLPGDYRLEPFEEPGDFAVFLSLLTIKRWEQSHA